MKGYITRLKSYLRVVTAARRVSRSMIREETELKYGPNSLNLMMADTCNSQCLMCGHDYKSCGSNQFITLENVKTMYSHLDMDKVVDVIYGGGGEPFMNPELADIAEYTATEHPVVQHTVITNLIKGNEAIYRRLIRAGVHFVCSVNAATRETFELVSGTELYDQVWENLAMLARIRKEEQAAVGIAASVIIMKPNISEMPAFVEKAAGLGITSVKTLYVRVYPEGYRKKDGKQNQIASEDSLFYMQEESNRYIREAERVARGSRVRFEHEPLFGCGKISQRTCPEAWRSLFVNFNGNAYPCPASEILFMKKIESGRYASGNIFDQDMMEFWNNDFWQALRKSNLADRTETLVPECTCCGNAMCWDGPDAQASHLLKWDEADKSERKF